MFLTLICLHKNWDVNIEILGIHCLPGNIYEMSAAANVKKPKIDISKTKLQIVTDLCDIPLNMFWRMGNLTKLINISLLFHKGFKIQDGCQNLVLFAWSVNVLQHYCMKMPSTLSLLLLSNTTNSFVKFNISCFIFQSYIYKYMYIYIYDQMQNIDVQTDLDWIGCTYPSGHISCPTHVYVSQSCFHCLNKLLKPDYMILVWGLVGVNKFHQIRGD